MAEKEYYWVKLDYKRFESGGDLDFLMGQKNGAEYVVLYMMLCLNTRNTNGEFVAKLGEVVIPYDVDKIVRDCKYFSRDTVIVALELYKQLGLIFQMDNGNLCISNHKQMVGSESKWASYKRKERQIGQSVGQLIGQCPTEVQQEIRDKSKEIRVKSTDNRENTEESNSLRSLSSSCSEPSAKTPEPVFISIPTNKTGEEFDVLVSFVSEMKELYPNVDVEAQLKAMKAWAISNPQKRKTKQGMTRFINSWLSRAQDKGGSSGKIRTAINKDYTGQYDSVEWEEA